MGWMKPLALIIRTAGTNCDRELAHAFELAGAATRTVHLNRLIEDPAAFELVDIIGFPGGFSYGDDIAAGRILANRVRHRLIEPLRAAVGRGVPMIGICNGFQAMVKLGLLPDPAGGGLGRQAVTLADNTSGRFVAKWVGLCVPGDTACIWTQSLGRFELPVAHGEGRFVCGSGELLERLRAQGQVALRYVAAGQAGQPSDYNPNGSVDDIAGICDPTGLILGLMPHPERYTHPTHHPQWTRLIGRGSGEAPVGLRLFQNAVEHVKQHATCSA